MIMSATAASAATGLFARMNINVAAVVSNVVFSVSSGTSLLS